MSAVQNEIDGVFQRVRQRDRQAFERLYVLTHRRLYGVLMNIVADREVAADLLQEGYLNIWFASARDEVTFPWAWMCQVMRHLAIDHIRQHGRRARLFVSADPLPEPAVHPFSTRDAMLANVNRCFAVLTPDKQQVIGQVFNALISV